MVFIAGKITSFMYKVGRNCNELNCKFFAESATEKVSQ